MGSWRIIQSAPGFTGRIGMAAAEHAGALYICGGQAQDPGEGSDIPERNDVWKSADGVAWQNVLGNDLLGAETHWTHRFEHTLTTFGGNLVVIGGGRASPTNEVWTSPNGANPWTQRPAPPWAARRSHGAAVIGSRLYVFGGVNLGGSFVRDVWSTTDLANWTQEIATAPWAGRFMEGAYAVHRVGGVDKIYIIAGKAGPTHFADVWSSVDGANWVEEAASIDTPWAAREGHVVFSLQGRIYLSGGFDGFGLINDIWSSENGSSADWRQEAGTAYGARTGFASAKFGLRGHIIGGLAETL